MISLTPLEADAPADRRDYGEVEYLLRRANDESIAAIRAIDPRVTHSHAEMARHYSEQSLDLIANLDERADETCGVAASNLSPARGEEIARR